MPGDEPGEIVTDGPVTASRSRHVLAAAILLLVVFAVDSSSFGAGFTIDSRDRILGDPRVSALNLHNIARIFDQNYWWPTAHSNLYRPVTTLSYLLNGTILPNRGHAAGYLLVNVLLHAGNAFLVYLLFLRLTAGFLPAILTASLWALHPIATEAVTYLVGRADLLAAMAVLGAVLVHDRLARHPPSQIWRSALMLITLAGLLAKEIAAIIPAVALLFDFSRRRAKFSLADLRMRYLVFVPPFLLAGWLRVMALAHSGPIEDPFVDNPLRGVSFLAGRLTAVKIIGKYLWLLIWPASLSCDYSYNQIPMVDLRFARWEDWKAVWAGTAIALLGAAAIVLFRRCRPGFFCLGFLALTLLPVSNLLFPIGTIMGDRLLYLPAVGFAGCLVLAIYAGAARLHVSASVAATALVLIALVWGARTWRRNLDWRSEETIWRAATQNAPNSFKAHRALAEAWLSANPPEHSLDQEIAEAEAAMNIIAGLPDERSPNNVYALLGELYRWQGDALAPTPASRVWYERALAVLERGAAIDRAIAAAMRRQELNRGKRPQDIAPFGLVRLYGSLGTTYLSLGRPEDALQAFLYQRRLNPVNGQAYRNISAAQLAAGRTEAAVIALMGAHVVSGSDLDTEDIRKLYDQAGRSSCAITRTPVPALNPECPAVYENICAAFGEVTVSLLEAGGGAMAAQTRELAQRRYGCR